MSAASRLIGTPANAPRNVSVLMPGEQLWCIGDHPIPTNQWGWPHGGVRCQYHVPPGKSGTCGNIYYWLALPGGVRIVVRVTSAELHEMQTQHMDFERIRAYLGLRWQRVA